MSRRLARTASPFLLLTLLFGLAAGCRTVEEDEPPIPTSTPTECPTPEPSPTPTATPTEPPTATPEPTPAVAPGFFELEAELAAEVEGYWSQGNFAFAVTDLQTRQTIGVNAERLQYAGCVMNLFVLMAALDEVAADRLAESRIGYLVSATTWSSNATTAKEIVVILGEGSGLAGSQFMADYIHSLELGEGIIWDHPPLYSGYSLGIDDNNWISARTLNRALEMLWFGDVLPEPWRSYLLDRLETVSPGLNYLVASVPGRVSHKNGFFWNSEGYVDNDTGIVRFLGSSTGTEYAYAATFLSDGVPVKYNDIPLGQELMRLTHAYFAATYQ